MTIPPDLRMLLACPKCHGPLRDAPQALICPACRVAYPVRDSLPVLLLDAAQALPPELRP